jgi:hypothetical protein
VLGCLLIAACANVLKTLAAKLLATTFHRQAHFDKMQDALSKVSRPAGKSAESPLTHGCDAQLGTVLVARASQLVLQHNIHAPLEALTAAI